MRYALLCLLLAGCATSGAKSDSNSGAKADTIEVPCAAEDGCAASAEEACHGKYHVVNQISPHLIEVRCEAAAATDGGAAN